MITCFNRDKKSGECLAYNVANCSQKCPARIRTVEDKINLLICLLAKAQARKDKKKLEEELRAARSVKAALDEGKLEDWMSCYLEDVHRGEKGGASESDSNRKTGLKQLMKDNRAVETRPNQEQQTKYREALAEFEEEHGKLEKLGRTSLSHSKINSYTGVPICFADHGLGHCNGQRSSKGTLAKDCRECPYLWERQVDQN